MADVGNHSEEQQIQVKFVTKLPDSFKVPSTAFAVPARLTRYGLSEVINTLLSFESPIPFDFLINGELLRTSLESFIISKSISAETVVTIEYVKAVVPPKHIKSRHLDDWVTSVDGSLLKGIFVAGYAGSIRFYVEGDTPSFVWSGHTDAITSLSALSLGDASGVLDTVASSSKDGSIKLWKIPALDGTVQEDSASGPIQELNGHSCSVETVAASSSSQQLCSGSWDGAVNIWTAVDAADENTDADADIENEKEDGSHGNKKRRRTKAPELFKLGSPLVGHTGSVSTCLWSSPSTVITGSWDHSLRCWDVNQSINTLTLTGSRPILCLAKAPTANSDVASTSSGGGGVVAEGGADSVLRLWDTRASSSVTPVKQFLSHKNWISAVKWSPFNPNWLVSASYDSTVKLWDIRSHIPVHTFEQHGDKVLCVDWWGSHIVSGGADGNCLLYDSA